MPEPFQYQPAEYEAPSQGTYYAGENVEPYASRRIGAPSVPGQEYFQAIQPLQEEAQRTRLLKEMRSDPLVDAQQSIEAAERFQGIQMFKRLKAEGKSDSEAFAASARLILGIPKSYAEAAAAERLGTPPPTYQFLPADQGQPARYVAPGRPPVFVPQVRPMTGIDRMSDIDKKRYDTAQRDLAEAQKEIASAGWFGRKAESRNRAELARATMNEISRKYSGESGVSQVKVAPPSGRGSPSASSPMPLPSRKSDLIQGTIYQTPRGLATWNGSAFEPLQG